VTNLQTLTIFDEMLLKQGSDTRRCAKPIGEAVGNDFSKLDTFLSIKPFQELYQLQDRKTTTVVKHQQKRSRTQHINNNVDNHNVCKNKASSVMGCDDRWPATVPSVVPTGDCSH